MEDLLIHNLFFWFYHRRDSVVVFLCGRVQCVSEYSSHSRNSARLLRPDGGYLGVIGHEVRRLVAMGKARNLSNEVSVSTSFAILDVLR